MAPFDVNALSGSVAYALVFGAIGFGFGAVLEMAGFGDTRKLAAQFYLTEMTVLKVMFTAIVVAAVLLALASGFGLLDMSRVFVNPTYLPSEILGGLIMGVGFVVGGFCPGTSLVAAATFKVDGILFVLGGLLGVFLFGESVALYEPFWLGGNRGRFTLPEWLGLSTSTTVLLIVVMALLAFVAAEAVERRFGPARASSMHSHLAWGGAGALVAAALVLVVRGDSGPERRWRWLPEEVHQQVAQRAVFASPAEVVALRKDTALRVDVIDLRSEHDFNLFHVGGARRLNGQDLVGAAEVRRLLDEPPSTITFLIDNDETRSLAAWKELRAQGVFNAYVVEGGVNGWLRLYPVPACVARPDPRATDGGLRFRFAYATGDSLPSAWPDLERSRSFRSPCPEEADAAPDGEHRWPDHAFTRRVKPQVRSVVKGGCG
ncbi:MAG TPA: YeeE/YedE thiosulfate transporter family protein [Anaeromyxobacter sp.]|nr:YeeE/YedE thiosulfate transporter family protein [Anaeromyxobacter sp.]